MNRQTIRTTSQTTGRNLGAPSPNWDALGTTRRQRLWDLLRKRTASTMFDGNRPDAESVRYAADLARGKLLKKIAEIDRLEAELLEIAEGGER